MQLTLEPTAEIAFINPDLVGGFVAHLLIAGRTRRSAGKVNSTQAKTP